MELPSFYELPGDLTCYAIDGLHVGTGYIFSENSGLFVLLPMCIKHQTFLRFKGLKVTHTTSACDSICSNATGSICKCSCGGTNHGIR